jgi:LacI family transcriptional regulator
MAVTLEKIAKRAGCSYGTVSNILSRNDPRYSEKTRERVSQVAKELGYVPHGAAQALVTGRCGNIGIVGVDWKDPHMFKAITAAGQIVTANHHKLMLDSMTDPNQLARLLLQRKVDLVIALSFLYGVELVGEIAAVKDRIVAFGTELQPYARYTVFWDDGQGVALVADHLMQLGHRRMAMLSHDSVSERTIGFLRYCESVGLKPLLVVRNPGSPREKELLHKCHWDPTRTLFTDSAEGSEQLRAALAKEPDLTAVFARNDRTAAAALTAAAELGIAVPGRLSVVGYTAEAENIPCFGRITSVRTPITEGIRLVLENYFSTLDQGKEPRREDTRLEVELAPGQTTGPACCKEILK